MRIAIAAIVLALAAVIAGAAAAGIFDRAAAPMLVLAFAIVLTLGAAPVVFSVITRRRESRGHGGGRDSDAEVHVIRREPPTPPGTA